MRERASLRFASALGLAVCLAAVPSCERPDRESTGAKEAPGGGAAPGGHRAPSISQISSATFTGIYEEPIRLEDGRYEGKPKSAHQDSEPVLELVMDLYAAGDLDGDGREEAAVLLQEASGDDKGYLYLAAVGAWQGAPVTLGAQLVGGGVQVRSLTIRDGKIRLALVEHGPGEPQCCPTWLATRQWTIRDGQLVELDSEEEGRLGIDAVAGRTWVLDGSASGGAPGAAHPVTLRFEGDRVSGSAGCNDFSGKLTPDGPGVFDLGPLRVTRRACEPRVMEAEERFLGELRAASRYGFRMGRLVLSAAGPGSETLLFKAEAEGTASSARSVETGPPSR